MVLQDFAKSRVEEAHSTWTNSRLLVNLNSGCLRPDRKPFLPSGTGLLPCAPHATIPTRHEQGKALRIAPRGGDLGPRRRLHLFLSLAAWYAHQDRRKARSPVCKLLLACRLDATGDFTKSIPNRVPVRNLLSDPWWVGRTLRRGETSLPLEPWTWHLAEAPSASSPTLGVRSCRPSCGAQG